MRAVGTLSTVALVGARRSVDDADEVEEPANVA
jgi:hypothetical protein